MKNRTTVSIGLYKWRYKIAYTAMVLIFISLLLLVGLAIPGGLNEKEMAAAVASSSLSLSNFSPQMAIDLPYQLLQRGIIELLGVSVLSIKLPTIIIAALSGIGLLLLLRTWFRRNIAILTALMAFTIGPFLLSAQTGTPEIMYIFWPVWILYIATLISRESKPNPILKLVLLLLIAGSLYTPLSVYVLIAVLISIVIHPRLRHIVSNLNRLWLAIAIFVGILAISPLIIAIFREPSILAQLFGIHQGIDIAASFSALVSQYLSFTSPVADSILTPVYSLPVIIMTFIGLYSLIRINHTARSYILLSWMALLIPVIFIDPQTVAITFIPAVLLTGYALDLIINSWYQIFPNNPYARVAGLIPIVIFIASISIFSVDRFVYGYIYGAKPHIFLTDVSILTKEASTNKPDVILVSSDEKDFYSLLVSRNSRLKGAELKTVEAFDKLAAGKSTFATQSAARSAKNLPAPTKILTDSSSHSADRFYIYKTAAK